jgi:hypothetical protein
MPAIGLIDRDYYRYIPKRQQHSLVGWTSALECARNGRFELGLETLFSQKSFDRAVSKRSSSLGNEPENFKDRRFDRIVRTASRREELAKTLCSAKVMRIDLLSPTAISAGCGGIVVFNFMLVLLPIRR